MSKNKVYRLLSLILAFFLLMHSVVFAAEIQLEPQDLIDVEQLTNEAVSYETAQVQRGSFINEVNLIAHKYYPFNYNLTFEQSDAKFLEFTVSKGAEVKKGDVLARFTINRSQAEFTRLKLDLQRAEEQTADGIRSREKTLESTRAALAASTDVYEQEILTLTVEKLETELQQYKYRQQRSIEQQRKAYNEEYTQRTTDVLVSPVDGVVLSLAAKMVDDAVFPNEVLVTVATGESVLWSVQNEDLSVRYNMPVKVKVAGTADAEFLTGRVVAADDAIPADKRSGFALIELDPYDTEKYTLTNAPNVVAESIHVDDVLIVPKKTVAKENDRSVVTKLEDGVPKKRYIETAMDNFFDVWVLVGVEEGETLVLG